MPISSLSRRLKRVGLVSVSALALATSASSADEWVAERLRGGVFALENGQWVQLQRGDVVPDDRPVQTAADGRVSFTRGKERLDLGPGTQVQIFDVGASTQPYTTVRQYFGKVGVEAEVREVEHFAVETPYLAAVVKGTRFSVETTEGASRVDVERGEVSVSDNEGGQTASVAAGESASVGPEIGEIGGLGSIVTEVTPAQASTPVERPSISSTAGESSPSPVRDPAPGMEPNPGRPGTPPSDNNGTGAGNGNGGGNGGGSGGNNAPGNGGNGTSDGNGGNGNNGNGNGNGNNGGPGNGNPGNGNGGPGNGNGHGNGGDKPGVGNGPGGPGPGPGPGKGPGQSPGHGPGHDHDHDDDKDGPGKGNGNSNGPGKGNGNGPGKGRDD
jgi:uncharacterized membrane protein YgcG